MEKIFNVVDKIAPFKDLRIKNNTQDWFDDKVAKAIKIEREKRLKQFKSTKLYIDEDLHKEATYHAVKLTKKKKIQFYKEKFKNIGKPNELWKPLKALGLPSKKGTISNICLKKDDIISFDDKANANALKECFCNLASYLVAKLPPSSNRFGLDTVCNYYQDILRLLPSKFKFSNVTEDLVL